MFADEMILLHDSDETREHDSDDGLPLITMVIVAVVAARAFTRRFLNVPDRWIGVDASASDVNVSALEKSVI